MSEYCKNCEALQQENEKLKADRDYYKQIVQGCPEVCENGFCMIDKENQNLTQQLQAEREKVKELEEQLELNTANAVVVDYATRLHEYKQALDEIERNITELYLGAKDSDRPYCEQILDIISKAKVEEE